MCEYKEVLCIIQDYSITHADMLSLYGTNVVNESIMTYLYVVSLFSLFKIYVTNV